jgi:Cu/Ag efflux protein CusF
MRQKRRLFFAALASTAWITTGTSFAQGAGKEGAPPQGGAQAAPSESTSQLIKATAKVDKVDVDKHELTLKGDDGKPFTVDVPESVTRLDNVKPGDQVNISFYESAAVSLQKPGAGQVGTQKQITSARAPGQFPGGLVAEQITTTAKITKLDPASDELTIETPAGKTNTIRVQDPQNRAALTKLKVGDEIRATYTEAMATSFTPKKRM